MGASVVSEGAAWIRNFGVVAEDPGFIYIVENRNLFKIGRSKSKSSRMIAAKTWLPDMKLIGIKPFWNARHLERHLHEGFARCWYDGEWFDLIDEGYRETLLDGFSEFSDTDRDRNSVDFIYWFNGGGMSEFVFERHRQGLSLPEFLRRETEIKRKRFGRGGKTR